MTPADLNSDKDNGKQTMTIRVPWELHDAFKQKAKLAGVSMNKLVVSLIKEACKGAAAQAPEIAVQQTDAERPDDMRRGLSLGMK